MNSGLGEVQSQHRHGLKKGWTLSDQKFNHRERISAGRHRGLEGKGGSQESMKTELESLTTQGCILLGGGRSPSMALN